MDERVRVVDYLSGVEAVARNDFVEDIQPTMNLKN